MSDFTVGLVKPGAVARGAVWQVVREIERSGLVLYLMRQERFDRELAGKFYEEHAGKPFYERLVEHAVSGPSCVMIIRRGTQDDAVEAWRSLIGPTDPETPASPATGLRQRIGLRLPDNGCHGSSSAAEALREILLLQEFGSL